jgi:hypothetical protein
MPCMFLIVKGNRHIAEYEGKRRNISLEIDAESENHNETYCYAPMIDKPKIIGWYSEDQGIAQVAQPGSCLWYAERRE